MVELVKVGRKHFYRHDGQLYPSVTTILSGGFPKPLLVGWAAKVTAIDAIVNRAKWYGIADQSEETAIHMLKSVRFQSRDRAATLGAGVHKVIEKDLEPTREQQPFVDSYRAWYNENVAEPIAAELPVVNVEHGYGGTTDLILNMKTETQYRNVGDRILWDIKTGNTAGWEDQQLQVVAYAYADNVTVDKVGVLHVRPEGVTEYVWLPTRETLEVFLAVKQVATFLGRLEQSE
jgi:hypothetical protein